MQVVLISDVSCSEYSMPLATRCYSPIGLAPAEWRRAESPGMYHIIDAMCEWRVRFEKANCKGSVAGPRESHSRP